MTMTSGVRNMAYKTKQQFSRYSVYTMQLIFCLYGGKNPRIAEYSSCRKELFLSYKRNQREQPV